MTHAHCRGLLSHAHNAEMTLLPLPFREGGRPLGSGGSGRERAANDRCIGWLREYNGCAPLARCGHVVMGGPIGETVSLASREYCLSEQTPPFLLQVVGLPCTMGLNGQGISL